MSSLQDKLYNYEQTPPAKVWDKISSALDESHLTEEFPSKLYNAEIMPPANAWDKIAGALETEQAPVIPILRKAFSFFRYAAAAVLIGAVAFAVFKWTHGNHTSSEIGVAPFDTANKKRPADHPIKIETAQLPAQVEKEIVSSNREVQIKSRSAKRIKNNYSVSDNIDAGEPIYAYNELTPNLADRYIMLMTPDGGVIRMSKKWGNLVCCVSGQEQDENCKDQLKKWQEKIACSPNTTSAGNFMDILSMVTALNDSEL